MLPTAEFGGCPSDNISVSSCFVHLHTHSASKYLLRTQYDPRVMLILITTRKQLQTPVRVK